MARSKQEHNGATVLLVDDDTDALELLSLVLKRSGYNTLCATNGQAGLDLAVRHEDELDLVLLDLMMPGGMDGYAVCDRLRTLQGTDNLPVVVLSAKSSPKEMARSYASGAVQHITKPYDTQYLLAVVDSMVRLRRMKQQTLQTAEKYLAIIDNSPLEMVVVSPELEIMEMNAAFRAKFPRASLGDRIDVLAYDEPLSDISNHPVLLALSSGQNQRGDVDGMQGGRKVYRRVHAAPIKDEHGRVTAVIDITEDITAQRELEDRLHRQVERHKRALRQQEIMANQFMNIRRQLEQNKAELEQKNRELEAAKAELERLSITDPLTGLHNRRHFDRVYSQEIRRSIRYQHPLSLLYMDIDHFKNVNDTYGHDAGDVILSDMGKLMQMYLRETDTIVRHGGEEFGAILPETDLKTASMIGERLRAAIELHESTFGDLTLKVTMSVGVAAACGDKIDPEILFQTADKALYRAKTGGRNRVVSAAYPE